MGCDARQLTAPLSTFLLARAAAPYLLHNVPYNQGWVLEHLASVDELQIRGTQDTASAGQDDSFT